MSSKLMASDDPGLGRLCDLAGDGVYSAPTFPGVERIEAHFAGAAYTRHRHDTYAIGVTMQGAQTFWYRGQERVSLPGQILILHPDEMHDGGAGSEQPLSYRMAYIEPWLLQAALGQNSSLPFVSDPVVTDHEFRRSLGLVLMDMEAVPSQLVADQFIAELGRNLSRHSGISPKSRILLDRLALQRAREFIDANALSSIQSRDLETVSGLDRFSFTRQFKALYGTSPHRYQVMRRLNVGRKLIGAGEPISGVAALTGFSDQSHFHRHFISTYGITPGRWKRLASEKADFRFPSPFRRFS